MWLDVGAIGVVVLVVVVAVVVAGLGLCLFCVARCWGNRSGASRGRGGRGGRRVADLGGMLESVICRVVGSGAYQSVQHTVFIFTETFGLHAQRKAAVSANSLVARLQDCVPGPDDHESWTLPSNRLAVRELMARVLPKFNRKFSLVEPAKDNTQELLNIVQDLSKHGLELSELIDKLQQAVHAADLYIIVCKCMSACVFKQPGKTWSIGDIQEAAMAVIQKAKAAGFWPRPGKKEFPGSPERLLHKDLRIELLRTAGIEDPEVKADLS